MYSLTCPHCKGILPSADIDAGDLIACLNCKRLVFAQATLGYREVPFVESLSSANGVFSARAPAKVPCHAHATCSMEQIAWLARRAIPRNPWKKKARVASICLVTVIAAFLLFQWVRGVRDFWENQKKMAQAKTSVWMISRACDMYFVDHQQYPAKLEALLVKDANGKGPYLKNRDNIFDPWGKVFQYDPTGQDQQCIGACIQVPDVFCVLPDGRMIGNWK